MAAPAPHTVTLTDLEIISRYSLAVGTNEVNRDELIAVLRADLAWLESAPVAPSARGVAPAKPGFGPASTPAPTAESEPTSAPEAAPRRRAAPGAAPRRRRTVGGAG